MCWADLIVMNSFFNIHEEPGNLPPYDHRLGTDQQQVVLQTMSWKILPWKYKKNLKITLPVQTNTIAYGGNLDFLDIAQVTRYPELKIRHDKQKSAIRTNLICVLKAVLVASSVSHLRTSF